MPASSARGSLLLVGVVSVCALAWCLGGIGRGDPLIPQDRAGGDPDRGAFKKYRVATQCGNCHRPGYGDKENYGPLLIKYEELQDWRNRDKHSYAYEALLAPRGQEMGRLLQTDVTKDAACLNCHAPGHRSPREPDTAKVEGVSCFACHSSTDNDNWYGAHSDPIEKWRDKPMDVKENEFGLLALRDPLRRSEVCLSCHVGDAEQGRVLTHEMYAAGHPPLPSFEVAAYSLAEPPHWWQPHEVPAFRDASQELLDNFRADLSGLHNTKTALIGGAAALREAMDVMAKQAGAGGEAWPELAHFECYACHHDLKAPGYLQWRQVRGYGYSLDGQYLPGAAGRPQFRPWPTALVRLAIHHVGGGPDMQGDYLAALKGLYTAGDAQPFGAAPAVAQESAKLAKWADDLVAKVTAAPLDQGSVPGLLRALITLPPEVFPDFDSAREIAWAFDVIYSEWDPKPANQDEIKRVFDRTRLRLKLDPFFRRNQWAEAANSPDATKVRHDLSQFELDQFLGRAAEYSPTVFKSDLQKLLQLLPAE